MSDLADAVGTAIEGGLVSSAVERETGQGSGGSGKELNRGHFDEGECLNCGASLVGSHCHQCGQKAHLHRTIGAFAHDLLHGALHLDGKMWSTLPLLAFKPGKLTRRYIDGERAKFVSPMAMFLFSIFLMFAVFQVAGISTPTNLERTTKTAVAKQIQSEIAEVEERREALRAELAGEDLDDERRRAAQQELVEIEEELAAIETATRNVSFFEEFRTSETAGSEPTAMSTDAESTLAGADQVPSSENEF